MVECIGDKVSQMFLECLDNILEVLFLILDLILKSLVPISSQSATLSCKVETSSSNFRRHVSLDDGILFIDNFTEKESIFSDFLESPFT